MALRGPAWSSGDLSLVWAETLLAWQRARQQKVASAAAPAITGSASARAEGAPDGTSEARPRRSPPFAAAAAILRASWFTERDTTSVVIPSGARANSH